MPSQLVCRPEQDLPVAVLRLTGVLDQVTCAALQHAVRRCLSTLPETLLIDVARLDVRDPVGLRALSAVVDQTAEWPAVPIVLCGAGPDTTHRLAAFGVHPSVGLAENCDDALKKVGAEPEPRRIRVRLRPVPDACRQARQLVTRAFAAWHVTDLTSTATLVATELVANVVRHAHTTMEFTVGLRDGRIAMTVRDGSRRLPRTVESGITEAGGRGLRLVRDLTDGWGVLPVFDGKVVWTTITAKGTT
jgi:anti-sigma regulatory factor (Ser/Thr protein kinase)/anti-anti-sigma regulatory factor